MRILVTPPPPSQHGRVDSSTSFNCSFQVSLTPSLNFFSVPRSYARKSFNFQASIACQEWTGRPQTGLLFPMWMVHWWATDFRTLQMVPTSQNCSFVKIIFGINWKLKCTFWEVRFHKESIMVRVWAKDGIFEKWFWFLCHLPVII